MHCPKCGSAISTLVRRCSSCKLDFGEELYDKFAFYHDWKKELDRLTELQNSLFSAIANVSAKIRRYETVLNRDSAKAARSKRQKRKKAPQRKKQKAVK